MAKFLSKKAIDVQNSAAYTGSANSITLGTPGSGGTAKTGGSANNTTNITAYLLIKNQE